MADPFYETQNIEANLFFYQINFLIENQVWYIAAFRTLYINSEWKSKCSKIRETYLLCQVLNAQNKTIYVK